MTDLKEVREIMAMYGKAWEKQDSALILNCFTKNGVYQESPLSKPYKGHKEIKKFWDKVVVKETKNVRFKLGKCYVSEDKKTGFTEWECKNFKDGEKQQMAGIMLLKMKRGKILYLNEYWNTKGIK